jgi:hypothetical protein
MVDSLRLKGVLLMATTSPEAGKQSAEGFFAAAREVMASVRETINDMHQPVSEPLLRDGMLAAAFRQGVDEIWQGLKPFPDTIQAREPGTFLDPLQSEVAEARKTDLVPATEPRMSPAEIAKMTSAEIAQSDVPRGPELDNNKDLGHGL